MQEMWVWSLGWEDSPGEGNGYPLQYSCLENSMDRGVWWATVHGVSNSWTQLSDTLSLSLSQTCRDIKQRMRMKRNSITNIPAPTTPCGPLQFCPSSLFLRTISLPDIVYTMLLPFLCFLLPSPSLYCSPQKGPVNQETSCWGKV